MLEVTHKILVNISFNSDFWNSIKLTEAFKKQYKEVPWHAMKGMRNRIVHDYGEVDLKIVYDTIKLDLPKLVNILEHI